MNQLRIALSLRLATLGIIVCISNATDAKIGCMSKSEHLARKYDSKEYHYVQCNCPCNTVIARRNKCLQCGHAHDSKPLIIITDTPTKTTPNKTENGILKSYEQTPDETMQGVISKYTKSDKSHTKR